MASSQHLLEHEIHIATLVIDEITARLEGGEKHQQHSDKVGKNTKDATGILYKRVISLRRSRLEMTQSRRIRVRSRLPESFLIKN